MSDTDPSAPAARLPTYFISHGGGPWPWMKDLMPFDMGPLERSLQALPGEVGVVPKAVLVVSAHWEEPSFTVQTSPQPSMIYDYGGFPEFTYHLSYPAPGAPEVADRVTALLDAAGIANRQDPTRGFDHGMYAPMYAAWPEADVPMLQLSILHSYDPDAHLAAGRALAPLRDEGVLVVGSGLSFHNLRLMGPAAEQPSREFDDWLDETMRADPAERVAALRDWERAPSARVVHPREDHLVPLMVAVGAAEHDVATRTYHEHAFAGGVSASSYRLGGQVAASKGSDR